MEEVRDQLDTGSSADQAASRGEYLCARLRASYLKAVFVDAAEIIRLNGDDSVDGSTYELIAKRLAEPGLYVIPGFYGATLTGKVKTFTRGGSDITGALVARAVGAEMIDSMAVVLSERKLAGKQELLRNIIETEIHPDYLEILRNMSIIAVVGEGIATHPGLVADLLFLLSQKRIEIRLIDEGSSKITVSFLVHSKDFQRTVKTIYSAVG